MSIGFCRLKENQMKKVLKCLAFTAVILTALPLMARVSPHETVSGQIDGARVVVVYGRPYSKDPKSDTIRKIWGTLVPWDKVWRMGSDEATLLVTQKDLMFGDVTVPAGAYTLYMIPSENGTSKLIINKAVGQWGIPYTPDQEKSELAHIDMKTGDLDKQLDEFTISVDKNPAGGGMITAKWEMKQYSVPFTVVKK
jgi:Protein of unknown function (DUF2911)